MTDFPHHTPRLLSEADAAADLAGLARPSKGLRLLYDYGQAITESGDSEQIYMNYAAAREYIKAMEHERDALAVRVTELESEVLDQCRLNGMGAERELALMGRVRELERHNKALVARREHDVNDIKKYSAMVGRLEGTLFQISEMTFDPWTNGAIAKQLADAALSATTPESKP